MWRQRGGAAKSNNENGVAGEVTLAGQPGGHRN